MGSVCAMPQRSLGYACVCSLCVVFWQSAVSVSLLYESCCLQSTSNVWVHARWHWQYSHRMGFDQQFPCGVLL